MLNSHSTLATASTSGSGLLKKPTVMAKNTSSRALCLILQPLNKTAEAKLKPSLAEVFLRFSPRVQFRAPNYIFVDTGSTAHLFGGEKALLDEVVALTTELGFKVQAAISDTPAGANALACAAACSSLAGSLAHQICHPGGERETLQHLSLPLLLHLEGLKPWAKPHAVEQLIRFFKLLGLNEVGELKKFSYMSFKERWGDTGAILWRRIRVLEKQVISPLEPTEILQEYVYLDFPIGLLPLLLHQTNKAAEFLFARLQSRRLYAQKLVLHLRCEYSNVNHKIELEPNKPSRDLSLFMSLLEHKLENIDLQNPIRDFEVEIVPCPENCRQLDFFEPRTTAEERLDQLLSILKQAEVKAGLFEVYSTLLPEKTFAAVNSPAKVYFEEGSRSEVSTKQSTSKAGFHQLQPLPSYSEKILESPRPTRLLKNPRSLTSIEVSRMHLLSRNPLERIQLDWWDPPSDAKSIASQSSFGSLGTPSCRDYYFAINDEGQCLWIYQNTTTHETERYYLHGYFD